MAIRPLARLYAISSREGPDNDVASESFRMPGYSSESGRMPL